MPMNDQTFVWEFFFSLLLYEESRFQENIEIEFSFVPERIWKKKLLVGSTLLFWDAETKVLIKAKLMLKQQNVKYVMLGGWWKIYCLLVTVYFL